MSTLIYILLATFLGSIVSLVGGIVLLSREKFMLKISHFLASFAAGVLLGAAFFDLLPEALHEAESSKTNIHIWVLVGILIFFILERFIHWFHHHEKHDEPAPERMAVCGDGQEPQKGLRKVRHYNDKDED